MEDPNAPLPPKEEEPLPERVDVAPPTQELSESEDDEENWAAVEKKQREKKVSASEGIGSVKIITPSYHIRLLKNI